MARHKVLIYCRVATEAQRDGPALPDPAGLSIDTLRRFISTYDLLFRVTTGLLERGSKYGSAQTER